MADEYTTTGDLYDPEVWADLAQAEFTGKVVMQTSGAVLEDNTLVGVPGSTVTFPRWMQMGDVVELDESDVLEVENLTHSSSEATIKEVGKAFGISDKARLTGIGNAQDEALRQFGVLTARKVDADLIAAATATITGGVTYADGTAATDSAPLSHVAGTSGAAAPLTWDVIAEAVEQFGDDFEPADFAGLFIRAEQRTEVWKDDQFIKASELGNGPGSSVVARGFIGQVAGVNVYTTNRLASGHALMIKRNALGLLHKQRPIVEQDRDILARQTVFATHLHYAVKRLSDTGVLDIDLNATA